MFKTIIAATDGSDHGTRAVKLAAGLARLSKAKLILVHVPALRHNSHAATGDSGQEALAREGRAKALGNVRYGGSLRGMGAWGCNLIMSWVFTMSGQT